jgi:hypothetical protein
MNGRLLMVLFISLMRSGVIRSILSSIQSLMIRIKNSQKTPPTWRRLLSQSLNIDLEESSSVAGEATRSRLTDVGLIPL